MLMSYKKIWKLAAFFAPVMFISANATAQAESLIDVTCVVSGAIEGEAQLLQLRAVAWARVGQRTDYDALTLEVWTDGSLKPEEAVSLSSKIMKERFYFLFEFF